MKTIKEWVFEIVEEMGIIWREGNEDEGGIIEQEAIDFATKLIAAWQAQQTSKPAGYTLIVNGARQGLYAFKQDAMEKGMEIGARFDLLPMYYAPPPAVPENYFADACRLAMELECLLLACKDTVITAKWWDSANEALDQHRERINEMLNAAQGEH